MTISTAKEIETVKLTDCLERCRRDQLPSLHPRILRIHHTEAKDEALAEGDRQPQSSLGARYRSFAQRSLHVFDLAPDEDAVSVSHRLSPVALRRRDLRVPLPFVHDNDSRVRDAVRLFTR